MSTPKTFDIRLVVLAIGATASILLSILVLSSNHNNGRHHKLFEDVESTTAITAPAEAYVSIDFDGKLKMKGFPDDCPTPRAALLGVMTTTKPDSTARRSFLREIYRQVNSNLNKEEQVDFVYVYGNSVSWETEYRLALEEMAYPKDTFITEREENMNEGKTLDWFIHARSVMYTKHPIHDHHYCPRYRFVGKTDDDVVIHIPRLSKVLRDLPTEQSHYVGRALDFYMTGMLYLLSADIVEWIHTSPISAENAVGHEDLQTGVWLQKGLPKADIKHHDQKELFHDLEESHNFPHFVSSEKSIVIHWCKDVQRLFRCFGDLYGTPVSARKRLTSKKSLQHHHQRLKGYFPSLEMQNLENLNLVTEFNIATQLDALLMRPLIETAVHKLIQDPVTESDWAKIMRHFSVRIEWYKEEELEMNVLRAIAAMELRKSDAWYELDVGNKLKNAIAEYKRPLTWEEVKKYREVK